MRGEAGADQPEDRARRAIRYALSRWQGLTLFLDDGRFKLDNNIVERSTRPCPDPKDAPFAGSDGGAEYWAVIASLVETCKLNGIDPQAYRADVITRIVNGHPNNRIDDLMPWAYQAQPILGNVADNDAYAQRASGALRPQSKDRRQAAQARFSTTRRWERRRRVRLF
ncbi:hypothetical protein J2X65_005176 [Ancylobacter sp. 3268]|nr:hypothetical protein [Ancylobacter sp. 3268]